MMNSHYIGNPRFRKFVGDKSTYYIPAERIINAADNILVDTRDPNSRGFGGSTFNIKTTDGIDVVKGPWHGTVPYEVCDVTELHFTKVTLIANAERIPWEDRNSHKYKKCAVDSIEFRFRMTGDVLYDEKEWVLGTFFRGDRIAQQLADLREETIYAHIETNGGSHSHECKPGDTLHPRAHRSDRNTCDECAKSNVGPCPHVRPTRTQIRSKHLHLSADQGMIVDL